MSSRRPPRARPLRRPTAALLTGHHVSDVLGFGTRREKAWREADRGWWAAQKLTSKMSPSSCPAASAESPWKRAAPRTPRGCPASGAQQGIATVRDRATQATRLQRPRSRSSPERPPHCEGPFLPSARPPSPSSGSPFLEDRLPAATLGTKSAANRPSAQTLCVVNTVVNNTNHLTWMRLASGMCVPGNSNVEFRARRHIGAVRRHTHAVICAILRTAQ